MPLKKPAPHAQKAGILTDLIIAPHVSEKASFLQTRNAYVFKIEKGATKILLKNALESRYEVKVKSVKILGAHSKKIRRGAIIGHKPGFKKAIVVLQEGYILPEF